MKTITVIYPNRDWNETINKSLKNANAKTIVGYGRYNIAYGRKCYQEFATVVSVDIDKLDNTITEHMQIGNKVC